MKTHRDKRRCSVLIAMVAFALSIAGCSSDQEVYTVTSIHKNVQLTSSGAVVGVADFVDTGSAFPIGAGNGWVVLKPTVGSLSIVVEFAGPPAVNETLNYVATAGNNIKKDFFVLEQGGYGSVSIDLTSRSATITGIGELISDAEIRPHIPHQDTIKEKRSFSYVIKWNDRQLTGDIFMVKSSHTEPKLLN